MASHTVVTYLDRARKLIAAGLTPSIIAAVVSRKANSGQYPK